MIFTLRLLHIFTVNKQLGPKIVIVSKMVSLACRGGGRDAGQNLEWQRRGWGWSLNGREGLAFP